MREDDVVELWLDGRPILIAKEYDISIAFLQVPNAFSIVIGSGATAVDLLRRFPPGTPFVLKINGIVQFMGFLDGPERQQGEATQLQLIGRDALAQLVDDEIEHDRSFVNATFDEITNAAFTSAGYEGISLTYDAAAHRKAVTGTPIIEEKVEERTFTSKPVSGKDTDEKQIVLVSTGEAAGTPFAYDVLTVRQGTTVVETTQKKLVQKITGFKAEKPILWKAGTSHYQALAREYQRAGLFLRAGVDPEGVDPNVFLLSQPNPVQTPLFGLIRALDKDPPANLVNVVPGRIANLTTNRHAKYIVRGRTGGGKDGRQQIEGVFLDEEMVALGYTKRRVVVDEHAKTKKQAEFYARKACADARRANRTFTYTVLGRHSLPMLAAPARRALPTPDICVSLVDDEHGMRGIFWVERVRFRASATGGTFTDFVLMVPDDVVFGDAELLSAADKKGRAVLGKAKPK